MSTLIRAIKITLNGVYEETPAMGLYTANGVSQIRMSESLLAGVSDAYLPGLLIKIGAIAHRADFRKGGGQVQVSDVDFTFGNVIEVAGTQKQFSIALEQLGISLVGCIVEILEFEGTETDSDSVEILNLFTGCIEDIKWSQTEYIISAKASLSLRRNANMSTYVTGSTDTIIPITFGSSDPENGRYFKAIRTTNNEQILTLADLAVEGTPGTNFYPAKMNLFPIYQRVGSVPSLVYQVRLGYMDGDAFPDGNIFIGKYILIKEGKGAGTYRKITNATRITSGDSVVELTFSDHLPEDLVGSWDANGNEQTWIQFINVEREYTLDVETCGGFYDPNNNKLDSAAELYAKTDQRVSRIPQYGYDVDPDNSDDNSLIIRPILFKDNPDTMFAFLFLPVNSFGLCTTDNLSLWPTQSNSKIYNGTYKYVSVGPGGFNATGISDDIDGSRLFDKFITTSCDHTTHYNAWNDATSAIVLSHCFTFKLSDLPDFVVPEAVYIGIKLNQIGPSSPNSYEPCRIKVYRRGYIDRALEVLNSELVTAYPNPANGDPSIFDNLPDYYSGRSTANKAFYYSGNVNGVLSGYKRINMQITSRESYEAVEECLLMVSRFFQGGNIYSDTEQTKIYELFVMIEMTANIKDSIYV